MGRAARRPTAVTAVAGRRIRTVLMSGAPVAPVDQNAFLRENLHIDYVASDQSLRAALARLQDEEVNRIGLDFETASKNGRYGVQNGALGLIQIGVGGPSPRQLLIDPFAVNPAPIVPLLQDRNVEKVIHYMDFEVLWAQTHLDTPINNVFCTSASWAAIQKHLRELPEDEVQRLFPGWERHNNKLTTLTDRYMGLPLDKAGQSSNWSDRPLTADQIMYAALDSMVVLPLADITKEVARQVGAEQAVAQRLSWLSKKLQTSSAKKAATMKDDSPRVRLLLEEAPTVADLDRTWAASRTATVLGRNRPELQAVYEERRRVLR